MRDDDPVRPLERHAIPQGLAAHPLSVIWWVFLAPYVYGYAVLYIIMLVSPSTFDGLTGEGGGAPRQALVMFAVLMIQVAVFWRMTGWNLKRGFGPAAGSLALTPLWAFLAIVLGGLELTLVPGLIETFLQPAAENWSWRDPQEAEAFAVIALTGAAIASTVIMAPVIEEIAFRGLALGFLIARGVPTGLSLIVTSAAFALTHLQYTPLGMLAVFFAGLLYGWLRLASGSVGVAILAHASGNAFAIALFASSPAAT